MKKILMRVLSLVLALVIFSAQSMAFTSGSAGVLESDVAAIAEYDESEIYSAFTEVNDLVSFIEKNEGITYNELETVNSGLISNVSSSAALMHHDDDDYRECKINSV